MVCQFKENSKGPSHTFKNLAELIGVSLGVLVPRLNLVHNLSLGVTGGGGSDSFSWQLFLRASFSHTSSSTNT